MDNPDQREQQAKQYDHLYLNGNEAMFLKSLIRNTECTNCPCFYAGCKGNYTRQELAIMDNENFFHKHRKGTDGFLCWKLTNIINMTQAERENLNKAFNQDAKGNLAILARNKDDFYLMSVDEHNQMESELKKHEQRDKQIQNQILDMTLKFQEEINRMASIQSNYESVMELLKQQLKYYENLIQDLRSSQ